MSMDAFIRLQVMSEDSINYLLEEIHKSIAARRLPMHTAVNHNERTDSYSKDMWEMNIRQFWTDQDLEFGKDQPHWENLSPLEQDTYEKGFIGLTLLDTKQSKAGMPVVSMICNDDQKTAVFNFMGMMESIHAKTYSSIFSSILSRERTIELFEWVKTQPNLQLKAHLVEKCYKDALREFANSDTGNINKVTLWMCLAASVLLESFLFYSGFFYPLFLAGQSKMINCGEGITKICQDEALHGVYTGTYAAEVFESMTDLQQQMAIREFMELFQVLYKNEVQYTHLLYDQIGLTEQVITFLQYNANRAFMNLGFEAYFEDVTDQDVNPIVLNGLRTGSESQDGVTTNHDFFSAKGDNYLIPMNVVALEDADFKFDIHDEFVD